MSVSVSGRIRTCVLALVFLALHYRSASATDPTLNKTSPPPEINKISLAGKFFCAYKRHVSLPFRGTINSVQVQPGQLVAKGEVLLRYHLSSQDVLQIQRRLNSFQIEKLEIELAEIKRRLNLLQARQAAQVLLYQDELSSLVSVKQVDQELTFLKEKEAVLSKELKMEKQLFKEELNLLKEQLGTFLNHRRIPTEAYLRAPINGCVIYINPIVCRGAELEANEPVLQIGVMNPMVLKAQVHEIEAMQLNPGDSAEVVVESMGGRKYHTQIWSISWLPVKPSYDQPSYYWVEFIIPNPDFSLKEGLKGTITLQLNKRRPKNSGEGNRAED